MAQKIRIKDIARMAGVSAGTVDRILHNRGNVSAEKQKLVEEILQKVDYRPNIHISAISLKKSFSIVVVVPESEEGGYWDILRGGMERAIKEFEGVNIICQYCYYDQYDVYSCRQTFRTIMGMEHKPHAVVIGPTFPDETVEMAEWLQKRKIPFVYVDSMVEGTMPFTFFSPNQYKCGYLVGKLIRSITPDNSEYALLSPTRVGGGNANASMLRRLGFKDYCADHGLGGHIYDIPFSVNAPEKNDKLIGDFFQENPKVKGAIVLLSRGHVIADYFRRKNITGVKLVGLDLPVPNVEAIKTGEIDFVVSQRPAQQGFLAIKAVIQRLIYGKKLSKEHYMPLDIITKENLPFYSEFGDMPDMM